MFSELDMTDRLDEIFGDYSGSEIAAEPEVEAEGWLDQVRHSVVTLGVHAWVEHMIAAGCKDGRSVKDCARTVAQAIEEVI